MNLLFRRMMNAPDVHADMFEPRCVICGRYPYDHIERHHVVPRSQGGTNGPTLDVCAAGGNILKDSRGLVTCHGALHHRLMHLRWTGDRWEYLRTDEPTKYERALAMDGWKPLAIYGGPSDLPF